MLKEAIQALFEKAATVEKLGAAVELTTLDGRPYIHHGQSLQPSRLPDFPSVDLSTLVGLIDALKLADPKGDNFPKFVLVDSYDRIIAATEPKGPWLQRQVVAKASLEKTEGFHFGHWYDPDQMVIELQTKFLPTDGRAQLLRVLGNLQGGIARTSADDGITQTVSVRAGVTLMGEEKIVNPVELKPYRTFVDLDQPVSPFVVRVKQEKDCSPKIALFEADGGLWKRVALDAAASFLAKGLAATGLNLPVLR